MRKIKKKIVPLHSKKKVYTFYLSGKPAVGRKTYIVRLLGIPQAQASQRGS